MCGIAGAVTWSNHQYLDQQTLQNMAQPLRFRGPDAGDFLLTSQGDTQIAFAHKRLSIIDLSANGNQPMFSGSRQTVIVFNGEIYNYKPLKQELEKVGAQFKTNSDTEVLLEGFERWGMDILLEKIDGMFAIALYDFKRSKLYLVRDRFGKKPLYYQMVGEQLAFSSDIRSFNALPTPKTLNLHAFGYFLSELATPRYDSIWQEIERVPHSHYICVDKNGLRVEQYWRLDFKTTCQLSTGEILNETDKLFTQAVEKRLVADVNVAAQLSGGIDSSLVVAKMAQLSDKKINTYSVGFEHQDYNELPYAQQVAKRYNTQHHEFMMQPHSIETANELIWEYGEPFADVSMIPSYLICKEISKTEKVVCGGDGGDELFSGYHSYYVTHKLDKVKSYAGFSPLANLVAKIIPTYRTKFLAQLLQLAQKPQWMLINRNMGFSPDEIAQLIPNQPLVAGALEKEHRQIWRLYEKNAEPLLKKVLHASLSTRLLSDYLVKVDRASMAASLEMRSPFLDKNLAEFAFSLSENQLMLPHGNKSVLKLLSERYLPHEVIYRPKKGFGVPIDHWFRKELKPHFQAVVLGQKQQFVELNYNFISQLLERHTAGEDHTHKLWVLYVFHVWANQQNANGFS